MKLLLINSTDKNAFAALSENGNTKVVFASEFSDTTIKPGKAPDKLIHCLDKLSVENNFENIEAIAVAAGPGSFTGIRVGLSLAKGLAFGLEKKLIPINNFELTFARLNEIQTDLKYCIIIEAKLPEYYFAVYQNGEITPKGSDTLENLIKTLQNDTIIVGDFDDETQLKHCYFEYINVKNLKNEADSFGSLAEEKFKCGELVDSAKAEPLYLKDFNFKKV
ncbi:MAG TPA: tRNA (adenosine(37)-N6)-threonylcarbamoyltransferase complex dimerization subunit type 1 TsaB [Ignavibacteria bacterium]|nr:tRNA (adenosine(37)-N6)-threonylcarbamoyltransferase complex dimerization subunit type 1 TsaB [Bacteroidota bacterium]HRE11317.1 tRNA (adenosine(37)-N6)-threonylcarbamoyltransferase complex dimerization subunit type 1 TsaB [Ignavibacteria bacterium]HRF65663.1 tRNA (adenosine(37)-N6)-threonylcarbamoyltransferase complex dimerization subunit type 1 TsaB [Ignavibacteria bacterium]HRJ03305.1 tRNA (adenosine(37)-N6)-threonylcarbamoyltransferase complex dimerization subunit type 1 TsaB [Ignavibacte